MALKLAGLKTDKPTEIKIENQSSIDLPQDTVQTIRDIVASVPIEHLRGVEKVRLVDFIKPPKTDVPIKGDLPGLYHPRQGGQSAWFELSTGALLQPTETFVKRRMAKASFKGNLAGMLFSLVGQHYYLTLRHSVRRQSLEPQVRQYAEKHLKEWSAKQENNSFRAKLFKPIRPYMERWAKWLNKKALEAQKKT